MKSRDEIVIIMLQWMRLYTLGSRGSRELKTFLETRLISSGVDPKLKNKGRIHRFLERKLGSKTWAMEAIMEAVLWRRGSDSVGIDRGFNSATNRCEFGFNLASKWPQFGQRSGHNCATIVVLILRRSPADRLEMIQHPKFHDHGSIAPRSQFDRTTIVEFFHKSRKPSN